MAQDSTTVAKVLPQQMLASQGLRNTLTSSAKFNQANNRLSNELRVANATLMEVDRIVDNIAEGCAALQYAIKAIGDGISASRDQPAPLSGYPSNDSLSNLPLKAKFIKNKIGVLLKYTMKLAESEVPEAAPPIDSNDIPMIVNSSQLEESSGKHVLEYLEQDQD